MRLSIIVEDNTVYIDRRSYSGIDMSWVPEINGHKIHAVQWLDGEGHIELVNGAGPHVRITSLGVFEKAVELWNERKIEQDAIEQQRLIEDERLKQEQIEREKSKFILDAASDDEDDQLFYDIEELLKEI